MRAFILAGGFATRLWPLTEKRAKPLLPLAGKPLLTHLVETIPEGMPVTVSTNAVFADDFEQWKTTIGTSKNSFRILIEDAGHEDEKLGALGAVAKWIMEEHIDDDVLLLAGDNYVGFSIADFVQSFDGMPLLAVHDVGSLEKAKKFGTVLCKDHRVTGFEEKPEQPRSTLISTGVYILPKALLHDLTAYAAKHPDNIGGIFEHFLQNNIEVRCVSYDALWFDIGSFEDYLEATHCLVGEAVLKGDNVQDTNNTFMGSVVLGSGSQIASSTLTNVVVYEHCTIDDCMLENCIIDTDCTLRGIDLNNKMLRKCTKLER